VHGAGGFVGLPSGSVAALAARKPAAFSITQCQLRKYRLVFAEGRGVAWDKANTFNAKERIDLVTLEQWIALHSGNWRSGYIVF
jgi:hypothetical protein